LTLIVSLLFAVREYMSTLPVTAAEMFLLRSRQPALILQAIAQILHGSAPRAVGAGIVLALALTIAWIVLGSLGRAAILKELFEAFQENPSPNRPALRFSSLLGLNFLRAGALLAALIGVVGAMLLAGLASSKANPSPGSALLIFWMLCLFVALAWSTLNWYLSLAAVFVVGDERSTFEDLAAAAELCRSRSGAVAAIATWFGIAHAVAFMIATSVVAFPLAFAGVLPGGIVLGGVILVAMFYFAIADFLYVGRLAACVFLVEVPQNVPQSLSFQPQPPSDDDILSDIPGLVPPPEPAT
jgi:hypothetical protein